MTTHKLFRLALALTLLAVMSGTANTVVPLSAQSTEDDLVFIHHSCGAQWLSDSLHDALLAKDYINERNDITYGTVMPPDAGRPDSLAPTPGDRTNMNHWILWFNDYLDGVESHGAATGFNRIIMFKSCYPISNITGDGVEPGDPFSSAQTLANYKAVYRHPDGPGNSYTHDSYTYKPLEDIFAQNPDILFIPVTAPPRHYAPSDATTDDEAHRARVFNNWLKNEWLAGYNAANPGLNNVAVFDWFDVLAYPDDHLDRPNRLKAEYGGENGDSHPNPAARSYSTQVFATDPGNFIDNAWDAFTNLDTQTPVLEWPHGGCYSTWCETGWYSSPAVADLDGDGTLEVIGAAYTLFVLNGEDGSERWNVPPPADNARVWPGVVVADIDADADLEIVTAHGYGYVRVVDHAGNLVWTKRPVSNELRGLAAYDLDGDGTLEIVVTGAVYEEVNTWVYEHDGTLRSGWPQLSDDSGYAHGVFNDNAAIGDVDGDGTGEIVVPSDVHYICAYEPNGVQIPAHSMYGDKAWGKVGVWESLDIELRGWGACNGVREESYRTNFAHGPAVIGDVNGDGTSEVVVTGNVYDCDVGHPPGKYNGVYIFNSDRSRFNVGGYDWQSPPVDTGAPLSEDWNVIESNQPNPVLTDLDGDGEQEIVYSSYDGRVHAFWLDKTEHGNWPYSVYDSAEGFYRFASEPVVADLEDDGRAEVIFASWTQKGSNHTGKLHILDYLGNPLQEIDLPDAVGDWDWNGALAAPTLANIDGDVDLEVVLSTAHSGLVAYDLPGTADARILWGTGRANYQRTGSLLYGTLHASTKHVWPTTPGPGDVLTYTITLRNLGPVLSSARVTDTLPSEVNYLGDLWASAGSYGEAGGVITWTGSVSTGTPVIITLGVTTAEEVTTPYVIVNTALVDDGLGHVWQREAVAIANGRAIYLPLIQKQ